MALTKIFNRPLPEHEKLLQTLQPFWKEADPELRASLENFALDHRVSGELGQELLMCIDPLNAGLAQADARKVLRDCVRDYNKSCLLKTGVPAFQAPANASNRLDSRAADSTGQPPPRSLVTLIKSRYMGGYLARCLGTKFPGRPVSSYRDALTQYRMFEEHPIPFRDAFCEAWNDKITNQAQHPKWAADSDEFEAHRYWERDPEHWEMLFGKEPGPEPYISALCVYPPDEVGEIYRPTIIDADANHLHYPSPPWLARERGGLTVALGDCRDCHSLSEFIHRDVQYKPERFRWFKLHQPVSLTIDWQMDRVCHGEKLLDRYPARHQDFIKWKQCSDEP